MIILTKYFGFCLLASLSTVCLNAQTNEKITIEDDYHRIVFYNVENFFDAETDTTIAYNEFTPDGEIHWTVKKYKEKQKRVFQALTALAEWKPLALMGFVEIENRLVLQELLNNTPLGRENYQIVHFDSDDYRGIDVGLLYHPDKFELLHAHKIAVIDPKDADFKTRDILYVKGILLVDTLHVFVNHWVSRWRGMMESQYLRVLCSETLKKVSDSICQQNPNANVLLMGDFNDNPEDRSILNLKKGSEKCKFKSVDLKHVNKEVKGTLKYRSEWSYFDQFLASTALFYGHSKLKLKPNSGLVFDAPFLLEKDEKHLGVKPKRTNIGYKYNGGFSDHLPIIVDIIVSSSE